MSTKATNEVDRVVGARIGALRKAKGISQTALGSAVGVTFQQVQKYEKGQNRVSAGRLREIAQLLEVPVATFFQDDARDSEEGGESPFAFLQLPGAAELLRAYAELPPGFQRTMVTLARGLVRDLRPEVAA